MGTYVAGRLFRGSLIDVLNDLILRGVGVDIVYTIEYGGTVEFEWDDQKNRSNFKNMGFGLKKPRPFG